ncbi:MAG: hypothetical protein AB7F38_06735, partial [Piscinibacter sp.]
MAFRLKGLRSVGMLRKARNFARRTALHAAAARAASTPLHPGDMMKNASHWAALGLVVLASAGCAAT